jgi:hypothetical protein
MSKNRKKIKPKRDGLAYIFLAMAIAFAIRGGYMLKHHLVFVGEHWKYKQPVASTPWTSFLYAAFFFVLFYFTFKRKKQVR